MLVPYYSLKVSITIELRGNPMKYNTPETFVVGETVIYRHGKEFFDVKVLEVTGNEVKVATAFGKVLTFRSRFSDGQHVGQFTEEFEAVPDILFHKIAAPPAKESFFTRVMNAFSPS